ncbi:MAG: hypothetical protein MK209_09890, partial [Planctomycetes bacterium]|nr:hypothetical protein [Planctomycetota bacterium]
MARSLIAAFSFLIGMVACSTPAMTSRSAPPMLEFRIEAVPGEPGFSEDVVSPTQIHGEDVYLLPGKRFLIERAFTEDIGSGRTGVHFIVYPEQRDDFRIWTGQHVGKRMAVLHKGKALSLAKLMVALPGEGVISGGRGGLSTKEAQQLAR